MMDPSTALHKDMKRTSQTPGPEPRLVTEHKRRAKGSFYLFAQQTLNRSKFRCDNKPVLITQLMGFSATQSFLNNKKEETLSLLN